MYYASIIKILVMLISFYYIRTLNIPDSYKFLLTVIPSLLLLSTNYVIKSIQYAGKNKPITVKRGDDMSDKPLIDEYFFENFSIELQKEANAILYEYEKPFWIQSGGYLDISNPNNFIKVENLRLSSNYTLEFWLRLKYLSNNNIASFYNNDELIFQIIYDEQFIYVNQSTKIPINLDQWAHIVIMRGKSDMIGTSKGYIYVNGIFFGYIDDLPNLQDMNQSFLFKNSSPPSDYNKKYHDLSNCSLIRFYDRSLTIDEIQNNYLKDAFYFGLLEDKTDSNRLFVKGSSLVFYLESRVPTEPIPDIKPVIIKEQDKPIEVMYNISKPSNKTTNKKISKDDDIVVIMDTPSEKTEQTDDWIQKAEKVKVINTKRSIKKIKLPKEQVELQKNWLDGAPKPSNTKEKEVKEEKEVKANVIKVTPKKENKNDNKKEENKVDKKVDNKEKKEIKTSKPIF